MTIYPNTDINISASWIRHTTGIDSLLTTTQVILRRRTITFMQVETHTPSSTARIAVTFNIDVARVRVAINPYESASASWGGVWTAVELHSCITGPVAKRVSIASNDAVVVKWWAAVWQLTGSHIYPSTCRYITPHDPLQQSQLVRRLCFANIISGPPCSHIQKNLPMIMCIYSFHQLQESGHKDTNYVRMQVMFLYNLVLSTFCRECWEARKQALAACSATWIIVYM